MIHAAGFTHVSFSSDYAHNGLLENRRLILLKSILENRLRVDTIHGYDLDKPDTIEINHHLARAASHLGAPVIVLHCSSFTFEPSEAVRRRKDLEDKLPLLEKIALDSGVCFAFENVLPSTATDLMEDILNVSNPTYFGFCYDSSHDQINGPRPFDLLERQSGRLKAVHLSDRIIEFVDHVVPGEGFIDFDKLSAILRQANITFPLLMEIMNTHSNYKQPEELLKASYQAAVNLYRNVHYV